MQRQGRNNIDLWKFKDKSITGTVWKNDTLKHIEFICLQLVVNEHEPKDKLIKMVDKNQNAYNQPVLMNTKNSKENDPHHKRSNII